MRRSRIAAVCCAGLLSASLLSLPLFAIADDGSTTQTEPVVTEVKVETPKIDKLVSSDCGETFVKEAECVLDSDVIYQLTGTMPSDLDKFKTYEYTFFDVADDNVTLDINSVKVMWQGRDVTDKFVISAVPVEDGHIDHDRDTLSVMCKDVLSALPGIKSGDTLVVTYSAHVIGTGSYDNTAYLEYTHRPWTDALGRSKESVSEVTSKEQSNFGGNNGGSNTGTTGANNTATSNRGNATNAKPSVMSKLQTGLEANMLLVIVAVVLIVVAVVIFAFARKKDDKDSK